MNTKTGDVYNGYLKGFQKKRNYSKKVRRNYFSDSSLESMKSKIRNYLGVFKIENTTSIASDFVNVFIDEIDKKQYDNLKIDDRLFKFYLDKRSIKYPNNFGAYKNHLIGPSIRKRLKAYDMSQQDLGILLGHKKSYVSELINGVSQFSLKDLVIIHRVLRIELSILVPTYLQNDTREKVKNSIIKLNKPKLKLRKTDLVIS